MKHFIFIFALLFVSFPAFAEDGKMSAYERVMKSGVLRCGYFVWPPYFEVDMTSGAKSGIYYEIVEELGRVLNLKVEWTQEYTLGQQVEALRTRKVDALCGDGPFTRSAMPHVDYSEPYFFISGYVYALKDNPKATSLERLNSEDVTFTQIDGDGAAEYLQLYFPKAKVLSMSSITDASQLGLNVMTGKADVVMNDPMSMKAYPEEDQDKFKIVGDVNKPITTLPLVMSVAKGEQSLLNTLNQGLDLMNDTGITDHILDKYDPSGELLRHPQKRYK